MKLLISLLLLMGVHCAADELAHDIRSLPPFCSPTAGLFCSLCVQGDLTVGGSINGPTGPILDRSSSNYVFAYSDSSQTITQDGAFENITFSTNVHINGWTHDASTSAPAFIAAQTGLYLIQYDAVLNQSGTDEARAEIQAVLDNVLVPGSQIVISLSGDNDISQEVTRTFLAQVVAGQELKFQLAGSTTDVQLFANPNGDPSIIRPSIAVTITRIA